MRAHSAGSVEMTLFRSCAVLLGLSTSSTIFIVISGSVAMWLISRIAAATTASRPVGAWVGIGFVVVAALIGNSPLNDGSCRQERICHRRFRSRTCVSPARTAIIRVETSPARAEHGSRRVRPETRHPGFTPELQTERLLCLHRTTSAGGCGPTGIEPYARQSSSASSPTFHSQHDTPIFSLPHPTNAE